MNKDYIRTSVLAPYISGLITEKRQLGYSYQFEEYLLNVFDHYCVVNGLESPCFDRVFLEKWLAVNGTEGSSYHSQRISFVRQLALYMNTLGIAAYIPVESVKKDMAVPHFLSTEERIAFFNALDISVPKTGVPYAWRLWNEYRVVFRLIYSCGLRNSEACLLRMEDVDIAVGTLLVRHSKGDKDRIIYFADDTGEMLARYCEYITEVLGYTPYWFFPSRFPEKPIHKATLDARFNKAWNGTAFSSSCNKKPTVHCLRHSFVVDRMNTWYKKGISFHEMMPFLAKYLGHSRPQESMYYYHLDEEANILLRQKNQTAGRVIPGVEKYGY